MRILVFAAALGLGGAERVAATMTNWWAGRGERLTLAVMSGADAPRHYALHPGVDLRCLDIFDSPRGILARGRAALARHRRIRDLIREVKPDVIVSHTDTVNTRVLLAACGLGVPVVVMEHTDPLHYDIGPKWRLLRLLAYRTAAAVVVLTSPMRDYFAPMARPGAVHVFRNPIEFPDTVPESGARRREVLYLGRLSAEKGVACLIDAFAGYGVSGWTLVVAGDGPERAALEAQVKALGLAERVRFLGQVTDVASLFETASIFVLPSCFEGLPNALCEAMVMGVASLATATTGAREVVRDEENGLLAPIGDADGLGLRLRRLMEDPALRERLGAEALALRGRVGRDVVMERWNGLVKSLAGEAGETERR